MRVDEVQFLLKYDFSLIDDPGQLKEIKNSELIEMSEEGIGTFKIFYAEEKLIALNESQTFLIVEVPKGSGDIEPFVELLEEEWINVLHNHNVLWDELNSNTIIIKNL